MNQPEFSYLWTIIVPGSIVIFSFLVTLWLYRLFAKTHHGDEKKGTD